MQELIGMRERLANLYQENATNELRQKPVANKPARQPFKNYEDSRVDDVLDDWLLLGELIDELASTCVSANNHNDAPELCASTEVGQTFDQLFLNEIQSLKFKHARRLSLFERTSQWAAPEDLPALIDGMRRGYQDVKAALSLAFKQRGAMLCAADWQSPVYATTFPIGANRISNGIAEHAWDYKRDGHLDALVYEKAFVKEFAEHLSSDALHAYLTNDVRAAFANVLQWLAHESDLEKSAVCLMPMNSDNLSLTRSFFAGVESIAKCGREELQAKLRAKRPSIVVCDAITNEAEVSAQDFEGILEWASQETTHKVAILVDATMLPVAIMPNSLLKNVPENVQIFFVENLERHHQLGLNAVRAGIVVAHLQAADQKSFHNARACFGSNISDSSVGALPSPNRLRFINHLKRHARNTKQLAEAFELSLPERRGVIQSVNWLQRGISGSSWYQGCEFIVKFKKNFSTFETCRLFEDQVRKLCEKAEQPINLNLDAGDDVSSISIMSPETTGSDYMIRIAVGTESQSEIESLCALLKLASIKVWQSARSKVASPEFQPAVSHQAPPSLSRENERDIRLAASVYAGEDSLNNYLCPENYAPTPLVELPADLNPFKADGVRIFAKMVPLVPLMNIKSIPAYSMLNKASERGELEGVNNVIESSSSNTVLSLSVMAKLFGIEKTTAIVDHSIAPSLLRMLRLFGIDIMLHPAAGHELFGKLEPRSERATNCGKQEGWINPGQYSNPDNPEGFARWLAPDLYSQTGGKLALLSCALGTCGTMVGVSRGLRNLNPEIEVLACCPQPGDAVPGPRERSLLKDVEFPWQEVANHNQELTTTESFEASVKLLRRGILGGPSSGMNYVGLIKHLENEKAAGRLAEAVREQGGEYWTAFLSCDSPLPHVEEYYEALGEEFFPEVHPVPDLIE
jgi:cysteine synthase